MSLIDYKIIGYNNNPYINGSFLKKKKNFQIFNIIIYKAKENKKIKLNFEN